MTPSAPLAWSLNSVQKWFMNVTTHPESARAGVEAQSGLVSMQELERIVAPNDAESTLERLAIYHHGYTARLTECLEDDYPALKFALGAQVFPDICRAYVSAHPSCEPNLNGFGRKMPTFIRELDLDSGCFMSELTQLEWALVESLHAPAPEPISAQTLMSIPEHRLPNVRFAPSDSLRVFAFEYPVNAYLQAFYEDRQPTIPGPEASSVAVVRSDYTIWRFDLSSFQSTLLLRLVRGATLGAALNDIEASAAEVQAWFSEWTKHGLFASLRFDGN